MTDRKAKYERKRVIKPVSFNLETEETLFQKANQIPDFSGWVKKKIEEY